MDPTLVCRQSIDWDPARTGCPRYLDSAFLSIEGVVTLWARLATMMGESRMEDVYPLADSSGDAGDERQLVERARTDGDAFGQLHANCLDGVLNYLRTYTESDEDAAALTQHVASRVLEAFPRYHDRGPPCQAWCYGSPTMQLPIPFGSEF